MLFGVHLKFSRGVSTRTHRITCQPNTAFLAHATTVILARAHRLLLARSGVAWHCSLRRFSLNLWTAMLLNPGSPKTPCPWPTFEQVISGWKWWSLKWSARRIMVFLFCRACNCWSQWLLLMAHNAAKHLQRDRLFSAGSLWTEDNTPAIWIRDVIVSS